MEPQTTPESLAYERRKAAQLKEYFIPRDVVEEFDRYVLEHIPTGSFLEACLENDLKGALGAADLLNRSALFNIMSYVVNVLPAACQGSPTKVEAWLSQRADS